MTLLNLFVHKNSLMNIQLYFILSLASICCSAVNVTSGTAKPALQDTFRSFNSLDLTNSPADNQGVQVDFIISIHQAIAPSPNDIINFLNNASATYGWSNVTISKWVDRKERKIYKRL